MALFVTCWGSVADCCKSPPPKAASEDIVTAPAGEGSKFARSPWICKTGTPRSCKKSMNASRSLSTAMIDAPNLLVGEALLSHPSNHHL